MNFNYLLNKLPYSEPSINEFLSITVMDYDRGKKDDVLGSLVLTKTDIINHKYKEIGWLDIYGSQPDSSNTIGELMNGDSNIGAFWKGRILLSIESFDSDKPKFACEKMETNETKVWKNNIYSEYFILAELHYGFSLPKENASYSVQIRWADKELIIPEKVYFFCFCCNFLKNLVFKKDFFFFLFLHRNQINPCVNGTPANRFPFPCLIFLRIR